MKPEQVQLDKDGLSNATVAVIEAEQDYAEEILKLSPVTPVGQKVGHWVSIGDFECRCSECHLWCYKRNRSRYCPSCGAKMQEVKE